MFKDLSGSKYLIYIIILALVSILVFVGELFYVLKNNYEEKSAFGMGDKSFSWIREIAENSCIKGDETLDSGYYNESSDTWWFDLQQNNPPDGCHPACVVDMKTGQADINWRCSGLLVPKNISDTLEGAFKNKYPQHAKTIVVIIDQKTEDFVRGNVLVVPGEVARLFLAAKIKGEWQIVHEGRGKVSCTVARYGFPNAMTEGCVD